MGRPSRCTLSSPASSYTPYCSRQYVHGVGFARLFHSPKNFQLPKKMQLIKSTPKSWWCKIVHATQTHTMTQSRKTSLLPSFYLYISRLLFNIYLTLCRITFSSPIIGRLSPSSFFLPSILPQQHDGNWHIYIP